MKKILLVGVWSSMLGLYCGVVNGNKISVDLHEAAWFAGGFSKNGYVDPNQVCRIKRGLTLIKNAYAVELGRFKIPSNAYRLVTIKAPRTVEQGINACLQKVVEGIIEGNRHEEDEEHVILHYSLYRTIDIPWLIAACMALDTTMSIVVQESYDSQKIGSLSINEPAAGKLRYTFIFPEESHVQPIGIDYTPDNDGICRLDEK